MILPRRSTEAQAEIEQYDLHPMALIGVSAAMLFLATIPVLLRFYVRAMMLRSFGLDDWLLLLAFVRSPARAQSFCCRCADMKSR